MVDLRLIPNTATRDLMSSLRTLSVLEHEVIPIVNGDLISGLFRVWLTEVEAETLLNLNQVRKGFCQRVAGGIKFAQYCGVVKLGTCILEVLPKVGMNIDCAADELDQARTALLTMLHSARYLTIAEIGLAPQTQVTAPLLDVFIEAFLHCALVQAKRGLISKYVGTEDNLPVIKGRFNAHGHLRHNLGRPHLLNCDYDEFTPDNAYNRSVKAALEVCRAWIQDSAIQRLWFETYSRFSNISSIRTSSAAVARLPQDRTTRRYQALLKWCEWLLNMSSPTMSAGTADAPGLLFDMNKLFEAYVTRLEETASDDHQYVHSQKPQLTLATLQGAGVFTLKPDITVWQTEPGQEAPSITRIVDAKWKRLSPLAPNWGVDQGDIYQMLAYAIRYKCNHMELVYPGPDGTISQLQDLPVFRIDVGNDSERTLWITVRAVALWKT